MTPYTYYERDDDDAVLFEIECELDCRFIVNDGPDFRCDGVYLTRSKLEGMKWTSLGPVNILNSPVKHLHDLAVRIIAQAETDQNLHDSLAEDDGWYWQGHSNDPDAGYRRSPDYWRAFT